MTKAIVTFIFFGVLLTFLTFRTPVNRLGSGFLIGNTAHILTYYNLVKKSRNIKIKFPNEDDIKAKIIFLDSASNIAILKLHEMPKLKHQPLVINPKGLGASSESVFTLGYPWTNTLEDQHVLIEGSAENIKKLIKLKMILNPVHSGSPLFNSQQEVIGMILFETDAKVAFPVKDSNHFAIPALLLEKSLKIARIDMTTHLDEKLSRETFVAKSRNNIVLIEVR